MRAEAGNYLYYLMQWLQFFNPPLSVPFSEKEALLSEKEVGDEEDSDEEDSGEEDSD